MFPTPIGCTPGHSSRPISQLINKDLCTAKDRHVLDNHSIMLAIVLHKNWLTPPHFNNQWLNDVESRPDGPDDPETFLATFST